MSLAIKYRPANPMDRAALAALLNNSPRLYRHLDWCPPLDWLGSQPFWLVEEHSQIQAALAMPDDPPGIAWIRLYVTSPQTNSYLHWRPLFERCLAHYKNGLPPLIPGLGLQEWFAILLEANGFKVHQHIVGLARELNNPLPSGLVNPDVFIRPMEFEDLEIVAQIDQAAFEPIWQNSLEQIRLSYLQAAYASVAEIDGEVIGFQISTHNMFSAHLARLAVLPRWMGQRVGYTLMIDLIRKFQKDSLWQVTINTQDNNTSSLALYQKAGFGLTGETYPVYLYQAE